MTTEFPSTIFETSFMSIRHRPFMIPCAFIMTMVVHVLPLLAQDKAAFSEARIKSTLDQTMQPAKWYEAGHVKEPAPLLILLHSWSNDYNLKGYGEDALALCAKRGWAMMMPHFRGPNKNPSACASPLAVQDVLDAVAFAKAQRPIDARRIYIVGTSGGGHMALMMASKAPKVFAGVSAWVPPTHLAQ